MPYDLIPSLMSGLATTLVLFAGGACVATIFAFLAGLGRLAQDPIVRWVAAIYVQVFRGTSALVQLFWFYFALPILFDIRLGAMTAGILVLGLNIGAYGAEVVRGAIESVPAGQYRAAKALNLTPTQTMRHVILPQALVIMTPMFGNLLIELLKGTALVSMITVTDLTRAGLFLRDDTLRTGEIFGMLLAIYFALSLGVTATMRILERHLKHRLGYETQP